jgi:hypothetical protein
MILPRARLRGGYLGSIDDHLQDGYMLSRPCAVSSGAFGIALNIAPSTSAALQAPHVAQKVAQ